MFKYYIATYTSGVFGYQGSNWKDTLPGLAVGVVLFSTPWNYTHFQDSLWVVYCLAPPCSYSTAHKEIVALIIIMIETCLQLAATL